MDTFVKQCVNNCCPVNVKHTDDALPNCCYGNKVGGFKKGSVHSDMMVQTAIRYEVDGTLSDRSFNHVSTEI